MMQGLYRRARIYGTFVAVTVKRQLHYHVWVWVELFTQMLLLIIQLSFWRAIYAETSTVGGIDFQQMLNYVILAQMLATLIQSRFIFFMGSLLRDGRIVVELLRPVHFQGRFFAENFGELLTTLIIKSPLLLVAWLWLGLKLPSDPAVWGAFIVSLLLGRALIFWFNWLFACLAFYTTETWGLSVVYEGVTLFFGGALLPLVLLPGWLQQIAYAMPFAQSLYVPVALLSQIVSVTEILRIWLVQIAWLVGMYALSHFVFGIAIRKVTIQGG